MQSGSRVGLADGYWEGRIDGITVAAVSGCAPGDSEGKFDKSLGK